MEGRSVDAEKGEEVTSPAKQSAPTARERGQPKKLQLVEEGGGDPGNRQRTRGKALTSERLISNPAAKDLENDAISPLGSSGKKVSTTQHCRRSVRPQHRVQEGNQERLDSGNSKGLGGRVSPGHRRRLEGLLYRRRWPDADGSPGRKVGFKIWRRQLARVPRNSISTPTPTPQDLQLQRPDPGAPQLFGVMPEEQATASRRRKAAPEARGGEGIDALPNEVLQHVLSFLPVAEVVQTCVLARRWRDLWKSMPVLRITCEGRILNRRGVRRLNKFVNHLLLLRDRSAPLHACEIELTTFHSQDEPQVNLWIRHALLCQARILSVHLGRDNNSFELLEDLPLVSLHLTRLELCNVVLNDSILNFSSCPALEELWMRGCYVQADMIMSQSLKRLTILDCTFYPNERTRISVPSLVTLELIECWGRTPLLESMPSLVTGSIKLADCDDCCGKEAGGSCVDDTCENCGSNNNGSRDCVLLNGLSEAKSLELIAEPCVFILKRDLMWCPTFSKLKTLLLNDWCIKVNLGAGALMRFLQHTPVLEKLTIQLCQAPSNRVGTAGSYNLTGQLVAPSKLKILEIKCERIDERVHRILMVLSTYGIHVEQINIQQSIGCSER
ncbi:hypothetical protein ZWY2020_052963 [Hordeum vulgare]|nr:hypothetical protein ZWY2020_052963 [Hordeum vulgare]